MRRVLDDKPIVEWVFKIHHDECSVSFVHIDHFLSEGITVLGGSPKLREQTMSGERPVVVMCLRGMNTNQRSMMKLPRFYLCSEAISKHMEVKGGRVLFKGSMQQAEQKLIKYRALEKRITNG